MPPNSEQMWIICECTTRRSSC